MKKIIFVLAFTTGISLYSNAQISIGIGLNANIGVQPAWAPVGYDHADYYYMPDIEAYYSVSRHQYIYQNSGRWVFSASLPYRYRNFDVYHAHKVVINEPTPYLHHAQYRDRYASFRGQHDQVAIRDSREPKYFESRYHPQHAQWQREHNQHHNDHNDHRDHH